MSYFVCYYVVRVYKCILDMINIVAGFRSRMLRTGRLLLVPAFRPNLLGHALFIL